MDFQKKFIKGSVESIGKRCGAGIIFFLDVWLSHFLSNFCELEKELENLDLNSENIVMCQFEKGSHLIVK